MLVKPRSTGTLPQTHRRNEATLIIGPLWTMLRSSLQLPIFCENLRCSRNHILPILSARSVQRYRNTTFWPSGDETKTPMVFGERASIFVVLAILMWTTGCGLKLCKPKKIQETCSTQEVAMLVCRLGLWWQGEVWGTMLCLTIMEIEWAWTCSILKTIQMRVQLHAITTYYNPSHCVPWSWWSWWSWWQWQWWLLMLTFRLEGLMLARRGQVWQSRDGPGHGLPLCNVHPPNSSTAPGKWWHSHSQQFQFVDLFNDGRSFQM